MATLFGRQGDSFHVSSHEEMELSDRLPVGNYIVQENPRTRELYLTQVSGFDLPKRLYGDLSAKANRILSTYKDRDQSTGVLLAGAKGSGKTLLAKLISVRGASLGMPTIVVNRPLFGDLFGRLLQMITQPCIVLFDEFEKVFQAYDDEHGIHHEPQQQILTLLDGVFPSKKLFLLTCNEKKEVDGHMLNRPGRLYYLMEFAGISAEFIAEYCSDRLKNPAFLSQIQRIASVFLEFNFDMLQALVEESNRYDEEPFSLIEMLNVKPSRDDQRFTLALKKDGKEVNSDDDNWNGDPFTDTIYPSHQDSNRWVRLNFGPSDLAEYDVQIGRFVYKKRGYQLELTRKVDFSKPDWKRLLS